MSELPTRLALARPSPLPSRSFVAQFIAKNAGLLREGLSTIATDVRLPSGMPIDVLAVDTNGALHVIDIFDGKNASWVAHALHHLRWVERNRDYLSIVYTKHSIDAARPVSVAAVVARLSEPARDALSCLKEVSLSCYRVRCFATDEGRFLTLERKCAEVAVEEQSPEAQDPLQPVELTDAEITDFLKEKSGRGGRTAKKRRQRASNFS